MSPAAESLRSQLEAAFGIDAKQTGFWGEPEAMTKALEDVRRRHDSAAGKPVAADKIAKAVAAFRRDGAVKGYVQLRHACLGAATVDADGFCLVGDYVLRGRLFDLAEIVPGARRQLKCFQALLRGYWSFPRYGEANKEAKAGAEALRLWLGKRYEELDAGMERKPLWFALLGEHINLLGETPCERYGPALLRGDASELQAVIDGLSIPSDSWVKAEAVLAQMRAAAALNDVEWQEVLPQLLDIAAGKAGIAVPPVLARQCVAICVSRHARCEVVELYEPLLDAAIDAIGNPWQRRAVWDAHVLDPKGKPCELAREMVNSWLKNWLIAEFFRLHAVDGGDERRTAFWQRYDPFIVSLWVGLSSEAMERRGADYERFARRAAGCLLLVDAIVEDGNALLIRIDDFLAVEPGGRDRPLHLFRWNRLDGKLVRRLGSAREAKFFSLSSLMASEVEARLAHVDEKTGPWESRFDDRLRPLLVRRVTR